MAIPIEEVTKQQLNDYIKMVVDRFCIHKGFEIKVTDLEENPIRCSYSAKMMIRKAGEANPIIASYDLDIGLVSKIDGPAAFFGYVDRRILEGYGHLNGKVPPAERDPNAFPCYEGYEPPSTMKRTRVWRIFRTQITLSQGKLLIERIPFGRSFWQWLCRKPSQPRPGPNKAVAVTGSASKEMLSIMQKTGDRISNADADFRKLPNLSSLSDEELAEKEKTAKLGEGVLAEVGYRKFLKEKL